MHSSLLTESWILAHSLLCPHRGRDVAADTKLPWLPLHDELYPELWAKMSPWCFFGKDFFYHSKKQRTTTQDEVNLGARFASTWNKCVFCCCLVNQRDAKDMLLANGDAELYTLADFMLSHSSKRKSYWNLSFPIHQPLLHTFYRTVLFAHTRLGPLWCLRGWLFCPFIMERKDMRDRVSH